MINYNMDRMTRAKLVILRDQCATYLMWWNVTPECKHLYREAEKCLELAKLIYKEYKENATDTYESYNLAA